MWITCASLSDPAALWIWFGEKEGALNSSWEDCTLVSSWKESKSVHLTLIEARSSQDIKDVKTDVSANQSDCFSTEHWYISHLSACFCTESWLWVPMFLWWDTLWSGQRQSSYDVTHQVAKENLWNKYVVPYGGQCLDCDLRAKNSSKAPFSMLHDTTRNPIIVSHILVG